MRTIRKRPPPPSLVQWRQERIAADDDAAMPLNYEALRRSGKPIRDLERALFAEQGGLCAYTGIPLRFDGDTAQFHIEHLKPQAHCDPGEDTEYTNLVACWPEPNFQGGVPYGAPFKGDWPSTDETDQFVSPLRPDCGARFDFNRHGEISSPKLRDAAANTTIERLGLCHDELTAKRRMAIRGAVYPAGRQLRLTEARKIQEEMQRREEQLDNGENLLLGSYCFAVKPAMDREVRKLQGIVASKKKTAKGAKQKSAKQKSRKKKK